MKFVLIFALALFATLTSVESIIRGAPAVADQLPFVTSHKFTTRFNGVNDREIRCTGALISLKAITTTAKCARLTVLSRYSIYIGQLAFGAGTAVVPTNRTVNPGYNVSTLLNNIAIFIVPPQTAGTAIKPVSLGIPGMPYANTVATLAGFGRMSSVTPASDPLLFTTNTIQWNDYSNINPYNPDSPVPKPSTEKARRPDLCTFLPSTGGDNCLGGDEGSAVVIPTTPPGDFTMVGVLSFSTGSGNCEMGTMSCSVRISLQIEFITRFLYENP